MSIRAPMIEINWSNKLTDGLVYIDPDKLVWNRRLTDKEHAELHELIKKQRERWNDDGI